MTDRQAHFTSMPSSTLRWLHYWYENMLKSEDGADAIVLQDAIMDIEKVLTSLSLPFDPF